MFRYICIKNLIITYKIIRCYISNNHLKIVQKNLRFIYEATNFCACYHSPTLYTRMPRFQKTLDFMCQVCCSIHSEPDQTQSYKFLFCPFFITGGWLAPSPSVMSPTCYFTLPQLFFVFPKREKDIYTLLVFAFILFLWLFWLF